MARKRRRRPDTPHWRLSSRAVEIVAYGALVLLFGLWQFSPRAWPVIGGGRPLLLVPLTAAVAMFAGPVAGAAAGVAAGVFWGLYSDALFGFHALLLLVIGCAVGLFVRLLLRNNWLSAALLCGGAVVTYTLLDWLCNYLLPLREGLFLLLWHTVLPNMVYTLILSVPIYGVVRGVTKLLNNREKAK